MLFKEQIILENINILLRYRRNNIISRTWRCCSISLYFWFVF